MANSSIRNLNIDGNLVISGSTTQLDVNTVVVADNNITINDIASPLDSNADGGGFTLKGGTDKTILWIDANDAWTLSEHLDIVDTKEYRINNVSVLNATTLGGSVVNSSLTSIGALTNLTVGNIKIDGSNIGLLTDLNLITLADDTITVAGTVVALGTPGFTGDGSGITGISTSSFVAPGSNSDIIINSSGALGSITTVPLAQGGTGGTNAATARTNLGVTATGVDTAYNFRANNLDDVANVATTRTNLGLGTGNSPTFGNTSTSGTGSVNIHTAPDSGNNLGLAGVFTRAIPPAAGSGHRFYTGIGNSSGGYVISHKVTSDAGVDSGTASVYLWTVDTGKKVYVGGTYPSMTTTNAYINDLAYPTADGSNGQVITTDGAGTLSFTSVSGIGALLVSNNLSDVASAPTSRTNLGLGTSATQNTGVFAQVANNLSDVTAATARTNLGITATGADTAYAFRANNLSDVTAATARTNLGITATGADTVYAFRANNLSDLANAATSRTNLGLGTIATQAANAVDIDGGAIDGATIGANSAQPATVTTFTSTGIDDNASSTAMTIASNQDTTFAQAIKVGNIAGAAGAGNIRWSGTDFQGHTGSNWVSLTSAATAQLSGQVATFTTTQTITSTSYADVPGYTTAITVTNSNIINVQVAVDLQTGNNDTYNIKLVRVVGGTPTDLYIETAAHNDRLDSFNVTYADTHSQSSGTVITYKLMAKINGGNTLTVNPDATNAQIFLYEITTAPVTVSSVNGATGTVVLDSDDIAEGSSNLYYTDARARAAISESSTQLAYNNSTGVLTYTQGDTDTVAEGSSNLYFTNARADARITAADTGDLSEGSNLYFTNARADARITAADTGDLSEGSNLYFTNARARAAISESSTQLAYNNSTGVLTYIQGDTDTVAEGSSNLYYTDARADARITAADTGDLSEGSNLYFTNARADARIGTAVISALSDVHNAAPTDGQVLKWVNSNSRWEPATDSGGIALTDLSVTTASVGTAALAYNNGSGVFTYTPPNLSSYLTSETSHADVVVDGDFASQGIMLRGGSAGVYSILADASANWNTAFGWGNHASGGYLTSIAVNSINDTHIDWGTGSNQVSTADIPENTNLYYTDVRADARVTVGINNVIAAAPAALDTLNELAAALGDDANFAGTMITSLAGKEPTITAGTTAQYYRGDKSWQTLNTTAVAEGTNLYYTNARADARITAADTGDLSEGSNLYFTNARARAAISESSTQLAYNNSTGVLTYTQGDTDTVAEGSSNLYYTDARADARVTPAAVSDEANTSTGSFIVPTGTTAQRPGTPTTGMIRFNSDTSRFEGYNGTAWVPIDTLYS